MSAKKSLFSDRNGRARGYSTYDLISILWDNTQGVIASRGLLDEAYGYIPSSWGGEALGPAADELVKGRNEVSQSRIWLNRTLKSRVNFQYSPSLGFFRTDGYSTSHLPNVLKDDLDAFFDFLEALHDIVSMPKRSQKELLHTGYDTDAGKKLLRDAINDDIALYTTPYRMIENGQIVELDNGALADLANEALNIKPDEKIDAKIISFLDNSISLYMKRGSSLAEKKSAIKEIAGALESLRKRVKQHLLSEDERDLFSLANNFAIRHQTAKQKSDYNEEIWYDWMFQVNLAALVTTIKIIQSQE